MFCLVWNSCFGVICQDNAVCAPTTSGPRCNCINGYRIYGLVCVGQCFCIFSWKCGFSSQAYIAY